MRRDRLEVMLVDDDAGDIELMKEAVGAWRSKPEILVARCGEEALTLLEGEPEGGRRRLVLLDLNMPGAGGRETLRRIRANPGLRSTIVVILTTSNAREDVLGCYEDGANAFIVKPLDFSQLVTVARRIEDFWLDTAVLP